jgi:CRISPR-associated protein Cmr4
LHDNDFAWFARYGLQVNARNVLDEITKESKNLWYEETLPADSLFYLTLAGRAEQDVDSLATLLNESQFVQLGGNETVGQGWFTVQEVAR